MDKNTTSFSERNGYVTPPKIYIREELTPELIIAICNSLEFLKRKDCLFFYKLERYMWCKVFNRRINDFGTPAKGYVSVSFDYIENPKKLWYEKLDYLEVIIAYAKKNSEECYSFLVEHLNFYFQSLNFAYRIVDSQIKEILPGEEIDVLTTSEPQIEERKSLKSHLKSLSLLSVFSW
ncbi:AbiJ-NTD4 domain-containing protein [Bacteroides sedimenti]|uniref:HEPN AbiJ-N-terminal domain-containing protein n=1 Tax=Bacteroides sedimenti TaxID=2136147 RepID=A0ABN6Z189_9BACE